MVLKQTFSIISLSFENQILIFVYRRKPHNDVLNKKKNNQEFIR